MEDQGPGIQKTENDLFRQLRQADDPDIRPVVIHVVDNGVHVHFPDGKLIAVGLRGLEQLNEGILRKGIALGGDGQMRGRSGVPRLSIAGLDPLLLLQQGGGVAQKLPPVRREFHAPVASDKELDAQLLFQFPDGGGDAGLGEKQLVGRFIDGAAF